MRQIPFDSTYIWNLIYGRNEPIYRKETNSWTWLVVAKGEECVRFGSLGVVDENSCIWRGSAMKSLHIAQGTTSSHLWWNSIEDNVTKRMCGVCVTVYKICVYIYRIYTICIIYDCVTLLYSIILRNIVNQLQ